MQILQEQKSVRRKDQHSVAIRLQAGSYNDSKIKGHMNQ